MGYCVEWIDPHGKRHKQAFPRNLLHDKRGIALVQALSASGLEVIPGCENAVVKYLGSFDIPHRLRSVAQLGWLRGEELVFVLPEKVISKDASSNIVYQPERYSPTRSTMGSRGTLAQWQMNVAMPCRNNNYLIFALCQSFAGALLEFSNMESGGFHLYGASSKGKTIALQCAASVWGNGTDPAASHNLSDADRGVRSVREFLQRHGSSRFDSEKSYQPIRDCAGYLHRNLFLFTDAGFKEACGEYDTRQIAAELKRRKLLIVDDQNRFKSKHSLPGQNERFRFYAVKGAILEDDQV